MNPLITMVKNPGLPTGNPTAPSAAKGSKLAASPGLIFLAGALTWLHPGVYGQEPSPSTAEVVSSSIPLKLDISRRSLKNFLTDDEALAAYSSSDGTIKELTGVFMIGSESAPFALFWDSLSCRLLGVLDVNSPAGTETSTTASAATGEDTVNTPPSPYLLKASGAATFSGPSGSPAIPAYFGFRLVDGKPEFLYNSGLLEVEERIWLEDGGMSLKQRFSVRNASRGFRILLPPDWKERVAVSAGTWKNETLTVPADAAEELILTYRLGDPEPEPADSN